MVALVIHELATNAAKYGALGSAVGKVEVSWVVGANGLVIEWQENGGPEVVPPNSKGYGTRVIQASLEQLGGRADFDWRREGLRCRLSFPPGAGGEQLHKSGNSSLPHKTRLSAEVKEGSSVLLVEDESIIGMMMAETLTQLGYNVVGPFGTMREAAVAVTNMPIDAAILDVRLAEEFVYPLADELGEKGIPFAFVTGFGVEGIEPRFHSTPILQKPVDVKALRELFGIPSSASDGFGAPALQDGITGQRAAASRF